MHITETARARANMTPQSRELFRASTLDRRLGRGTVAGALNDQVRFRFDKHGLPGAWTLVPDNELSARLLASKAGPRLQTSIRGLLGNVDSAAQEGLFRADGIMLAKDERSWAAGYMLMDRDNVHQGHATRRLVQDKDALANAQVTANLADAQSILGWVQVAPDLSRNILAAANAYTPAADEAYARSAYIAHYTGRTIGHELQHRVSEAKLTTEGLAAYDKVAWLEEGTASFLSAVGRSAARSDAAWGVSMHAAAAEIGARDAIDTGWGRWTRDHHNDGDFASDSKAHYVDSLVTIRSLLHLANVDLRTTAGQARAFDLLQRQDVFHAPGRIAQAIVAAHGGSATSGQVSALAELVTAANTREGLHAVQAFVADMPAQA
ncbi:MAG: hypothetical protein H7287_00925 [Thermoleophilia bacterium]|nr:hypothetical protein [Thermoleophilia bacterium]